MSAQLDYMWSLRCPIRPHIDKSFVSWQDDGFGDSRHNKPRSQYTISIKWVILKHFSKHEVPFKNKLRITNSTKETWQGNIKKNTDKDNKSKTVWWWISQITSLPWWLSRGTLRGCFSIWWGNRRSQIKWRWMRWRTIHQRKTCSSLVPLERNSD